MPLIGQLSNSALGAMVERLLGNQEGRDEVEREFDGLMVLGSMQEAGPTKESVPRP